MIQFIAMEPLNEKVETKQGCEGGLTRDDISLAYRLARSNMPIICPNVATGCQMDHNPLGQKYFGYLHDLEEKTLQDFHLPSN